VTAADWAGHCAAIVGWPGIPRTTGTGTRSPRPFADHKILLRPELGPIEVDCQVLFTEDLPTQWRRSTSRLPVASASRGVRGGSLRRDRWPALRSQYP
jgi:hypothetical protein